MKTIELRHPDGYGLADEVTARWLSTQVDRILSYVRLNDLEGAQRESKTLSDALADEQIPPGAYYNGFQR